MNTSSAATYVEPIAIESTRFSVYLPAGSALQKLGAVLSLDVLEHWFPRGGTAFGEATWQPNGRALRHEDALMKLALLPICHGEWLSQSGVRESDHHLVFVANVDRVEDADAARMASDIEGAMYAVYLSVGLAEKHARFVKRSDSQSPYQKLIWVEAQSSIYVVRERRDLDQYFRIQ